jgi:UDP-N-acetyl-D-glucosamine dehydrogenase
MTNNRVAVVGLGYVGLPLALLAADKGYEVTGIDTVEEKVSHINEGKSPIVDEYLEKEIKKTKIKATTNITEVRNADILIICVPTPVKDGITPDLGPLKGAVKAAASVMKKGALLIIESTINPGVCDDVVLPLVTSTSGYSSDDFHLVHCPERINPGDPEWSVRNINRVVGSNTKEGLKRAVNFYESILDAEIKPMATLKEAEAVKVVENSFRDINIAFVNELAMSFQRMGINIENVIDGAATKPFAFMPHRPGCGVGGHCIPVDPYYLIEYARGFGFNHDFLSLARRINSQMPEFTVELMKDTLNDVGLPMKGTKIVLLGLAYKPNVDDDRESPAYEIQKLMKESGAEVIAYDPYIPSKSDADTLDEALCQADAILLATHHKVFNKISASSLINARVKVVVDGRNMFKDRKEEFIKAGIAYSGIGIH